VRSTRRLVLLQFRASEPARRQEKNCFQVVGRLAEAELISRDVLGGPALRWEEVADADAVLLGGAGEHSATESHPFSPYLNAVLQRLLAENRPVFGSCFGHHVLAQVTGGQVVTDGAREELGSFEIELTQQGRSDPLLAGLPERFTAQLGHHDRVASLGPGVVELAVSERCPCQMLRVVGKPAYGAQFHAEMDAADVLERLRIYLDGYLPVDETLDDVRRRLRPSPVALAVLRRFVELYV
jgi:GMP synthase (glutamine-hydrolysing)